MMSDDGRPDPDALLAAAVAAATEAQRGKLKIFFGASPGVGKTYAMLLEARRLRAEGLDVVVGVVETHGRSEPRHCSRGWSCCRASAWSIAVACWRSSTSTRR